MSQYYRLQGVQGAQAEYEALPDEIRALYSYEQYLWLNEAEKARLLQTETEPDFLD